MVGLASALHLEEAFLKQGQALEVLSGKIVTGRKEPWPDVDEREIVKQEKNPERISRLMLARPEWLGGAATRLPPQVVPQQIRKQPARTS